VKSEGQSDRMALDSQSPRALSGREPMQLIWQRQMAPAVCKFQVEWLCREDEILLQHKGIKPTFPVLLKVFNESLRKNQVFDVRPEPCTTF
jgi:hypothetical protein